MLKCPQYPERQELQNVFEANRPFNSQSLLVLHVGRQNVYFLHSVDQYFPDLFTSLFLKMIPDRRGRMFGRFHGTGRLLKLFSIR